MTSSLIIPNRNAPAVSYPWLLSMVERLYDQHSFLSHVYYLVKQGDTFGERLKCTNCQGRHDYITLKCINRPFTGLIGGLYAYYHLVKDNDLIQDLNPGERAQYDMIVDSLQGIPNLANQHPEMARKMVSDLGPSDLKAGALSMGILEGISTKEATILAEKINDKGIRPKFKLDVLNPYEKIRRELRRAVQVHRVS